MNLKEFWQAVYVAAIRAGHGTQTASDDADRALRALRERLNRDFHE